MIPVARGHLNIGEADCYTIELIAGIRHRIYVDTENQEADFDVCVTDMSDNILVIDNGHQSDALCYCTPVKVGEYRIYVASAYGSSSYNLYISQEMY